MMISPFCLVEKDYIGRKYVQIHLQSGFIKVMGEIIEQLMACVNEVGSAA
jgi:hypothetical protein